MFKTFSGHNKIRGSTNKFGGHWPRTTARGYGPSPNREIRTTMVRPHEQNAPGKISGSSPSGYTHVKVAQDWPRIRWRDYISDFACFRHGMKLKELSEMPENCEVLRVFLARAFAPATLLRGKAGMKMNEKMNTHRAGGRPPPLVKKGLPNRMRNFVRTCRHTRTDFTHFPFKGLHISNTSNRLIFPRPTASSYLS